MERPYIDWQLAGEQSRSAVVRAKVEWADHHRGLLHAALKDFRDRKPYFVSEDRRAWDGIEYRVLTATPDPAPDQLGFILADFVQNLRAALDYLVGEMRDDGASRNSAFPLVLQRPKGPHGFRKRQCIALHGIPDEAVKLIHWMQPYHRPGGGGGVRDALRVIEVLWNISKHRTLFVVTAVSRPDYVGRERTDEEAKSIGFRFPLSDNSSEIWLPVSEPEEQFDEHFTVHVSLAKPRGFADDWLPWFEHWEIDGLVDYLHNVVGYQVVPQFNPFLKGT
jgi:hypothetical protein